MFFCFFIRKLFIRILSNYGDIEVCNQAGLNFLLLACTKFLICRLTVNFAKKTSHLQFERQIF